MTKHEFIFSNRRNHRFARHLAFWTVWWLSFTIFFHWPVHTFNGWNVSSSTNPNIENLGLFRLILKTLFINSFLAVVLPEIAFCLLLMYWLLPDYFYRKRKFWHIALVIFIAVPTYLFLATAFKYAVPLFNYLLGATTTLLSFNFFKVMQIVVVDQVTTLPIVAGVAVMIKLVKRWWWKQKETEQLAKEKTTAELQLLKAQIHPHFLFNTLNNIYFFTLTNSTLAPAMIQKLRGLLRYILNECNQPFVSLDNEISMIRDYMALEKIRYGEQLQMSIELPGDHSGKLIAPLLLIPFVENCFKHGASKMIEHPWIRLKIGLEDDFLDFSISNSRPSTGETAPVRPNIGLKNVKKRLELLYPEAHILTITDELDTFSVQLQIKLKGMVILSAHTKEIKTKTGYAMA